MAVKRAAKKATRSEPGGRSTPSSEVAADGATGGTGGKRILLVDDDPEIVESMRAVLESRGYAFLVARDGNQGLALAEAEEPDLVVLDLMMP